MSIKSWESALAEQRTASVFYQIPKSTGWIDLHQPAFLAIRTATWRGAFGASMW